MKKISVGIAEDHELALQSILRKLSLLDYVSADLIAGNGRELLGKFALQQTDVVLMDIEMPLLDGITATRQLKTEYPGVRVLMLTTFDDDDKIFNAILAGASGYLLKDEGSEVIGNAIRDVMEGGAAMSAAIAMKTLQYIRQSGTPSEEPDIKSETILSLRETEILTWLKNGLGYKQIADKLFISEGTVRKHIENIYRKLQVNNKISAVNVAMENKWL